ncbi:MAG: hypothetical protein AAGF07_02230 [Patescibacteria group bacterium]
MEVATKSVEKLVDLEEELDVESLSSQESEIDQEISVQDLSNLIEESFLDVVDESELYKLNSEDVLVIDSLLDTIKSLEITENKVTEYDTSANIWEETSNDQFLLARFCEVFSRDHGLPSIYDLNQMYSADKKRLIVNKQELDKTQLETIKNGLISTLEKLKQDRLILGDNNIEISSLRSMQDLPLYDLQVNQRLLRNNKPLEVKFAFSSQSENTDVNLQAMVRKLNLVLNQYMNSGEDNFAVFLQNAIQQNHSSLASALPMGLNLKNISPNINREYYNLALPEEFEGQTVYRLRLNTGNRMRFTLKTKADQSQQLVIYYIGNDH